jgi:hypothetical protein
MKKLFCVLFFVVLAVGLARAASITVSKPAANETWYTSHSYSILWTKSGTMPDTVRITLRSGGSEAKLIADPAPNSGTYQWTVPTDVNPGSYKIRVKAIGAAIHGDSELFNIIKLTAAPLPGEKKLAKPGPKEAPGPPVEMLEVEELPAWYLNKMNRDWNSNEVPRTPPSACTLGRDQGWPAGADPNTYAHVGYDYFFCQEDNIQWRVTISYRSRVLFQVQVFQAKADKLVRALMHVKQIAVLQSNDSSASCATGFSTFLDTWPDWYNFQVTDTRGLPFGSTEYDVDITDIVKKWLDGSLANYGLLMASQEVYWGNQERKCISVFTVKLILKFNNS